MFHSQPSKSPPPSQSRRPRPYLEILEDRCVPALFTVNTLLDTPDANPGDGIAADSVGFTSLRAAIEEAETTTAHDVIQFAPGLIGPIYLLSALPDIITSLMINGPGYSDITVERAGPQDYRIFTFLQPFGSSLTWEVNGLTIANGRSDFGGGIYVSGQQSTLQCNDVVFTGNQVTDSGGAIANSQSSVTLMNCDLYLNTAVNYGGAVFASSGNTDIVYSRIFANAAKYGGGIAHLGTGVTDVWGGSEIYSNSASINGGGIWVSFGEVNITSSYVHANTAVGNGGGYYGDNAGSTFIGSDFTNNSANKGGGIYLDTNTQATIDGGSVLGNTATTIAPGVFENRTGGAFLTVINAPNIQHFHSE